MASPADAPDHLELVRAFVNTLDIEAGTDLLSDAAGWTSWAPAHGLTGTPSPVGLRRLRDLREALRLGLVANHDRAPLPEDTRQAMEAALRWSRARVEVGVSGLEVRPEGEGGAHELAGRVVAAALAGLSDGRWGRLKACRDDACRWAFYDHSRSRTGQWCSMEVCGNRNKQARWRARRS